MILKSILRFICLLKSSFDKKKDFDMNAKTKRAPFVSFYDNSVFTVTAILMNNIIEVKENDKYTRTVFRGLIKHSNNGAREIKICDVDVAMLFERLLPQPTIDNNTPFCREIL
ncbi:hypothetical protein CWI36_2330p0010 [Hamiltosporidium magnivora]|uniref:Uncharacterized protein n=1 Tax=Hamiltosporidium magnivora TaxID=148818 RepID=A0A4Q9KUP8_9MICR|nr:hypothetical protein CWI36_2330p0010 [Hamiltosporidium magnivora]